uniref:Calponin-homology (CH) domain-containing protein n=1 Tax=Gouania willdenowi TaxID=441366 RepID=A0A8C5GWG1_GOUWI
MKSVRELQEWCRSSCSSYSNVHIRDLSSSFRDGLAFLDGDTHTHTHTRAFEVAETKLGIPSLLDPKDVATSFALFILLLPFNPCPP